MQTRVTTKEFFAVMWWEVIQNIPLLAGLIGGLWFWQRNWLATTAFIMGGSLLSALSMIPTEHRIFEGHRESTRAIVANVLTFSVLMFVTIAYLKASWSSWQTDIIAGLIAGAALGTVQGLAGKGRVVVVRVLSLGVSCLVSLIVVRLTVNTWSPLVSFVIVTVWFTLAMGIYKLWRRRWHQQHLPSQ
jgi:hypothetical protein